MDISQCDQRRQLAGMGRMKYGMFITMLIIVMVAFASVLLVKELNTPACFVQVDLHKRIDCDDAKRELKAGRHLQ
jgi:hypothetical protein